MRSTLTSKTATVKKLLEEGFEPFAVIGIKRENKSGGEMVPDFKVYFRRSDGVEILEATESKPIEINLEPLALMLTEFFTQHQEMVMRENKSLLDNIEGFLELIKMRGISDEGSHRTLIIPPDFSDESQPTDAELDWHGGEEQPEVNQDDEDLPDGDSFRVVEDVPAKYEDEPTATELQNAALDRIRDKHKTNLTMFHPDSNGVIQVMVENFIYRINPDGTTTSEDTGAGTSSLVVG